MSAWLERSDIDVRFVSKSERTTLDWEEVRAKGVGDFCVRAVSVPGDHTEAILLVGAIPLSKAVL